MLDFLKVFLKLCLEESAADTWKQSSAIGFAHLKDVPLRCEMEDGSEQWTHQFMINGFAVLI